MAAATLETARKLSSDLLKSPEWQKSLRVTFGHELDPLDVNQISFDLAKFLILRSLYDKDIHPNVTIDSAWHTLMLIPALNFKICTEYFSMPYLEHELNEELCGNERDKSQMFYLEMHDKVFGSMEEEEKSMNVGEGFSIFVRNLYGRLNTIDNLHSEMTIGELRSRVETKTKVPQSIENLNFQSKSLSLLNQDQTLSHYCIKSGATLTSYLKLSGC
jgi:hypothetical protein